MRLHPVLSLTLLASLSTPLLTAQQPEGPPPAKLDQSRGPWEGAGMRSGLRIGPPGAWWHNPDLIQKLALTADQQKRMDDILQQSRLHLIDLRANVEKQEVLMEPMLSANPPDTAKVLDQVDRMVQARGELEKANARMLLSIREVLTSDQWPKLQAEWQQHRSMRMHHGDMPGGPGTPNGPGMF